MSTHPNTDLFDLFLREREAVTTEELLYAASNQPLGWSRSDPESPRRRSVFEEPREEEEAPAPLPCITFSRCQVLLYNLRALGYDLSKVAANDNAQGRLETALEVALSQKRGLTGVEEIAAALGLGVDAVRTAANDLHAAAKAR